MSYVCLWSPAWCTRAFDAERELLPLLPACLAHAPRVVVGTRTAGICLWADARGLHAATLAEQLLDVLRVHGITDARAGTALTPIAAEAGATWEPVMEEAVMRSMAAGDVVVRRQPFITVVRPGRDRAFIADFPVSMLSPDEAMANLLDGIGVDSCGRLAEIDAGSLEIRLGPAGVTLWERARGDDARWLFRTPLRSLPSASLEWTEYALRNTERLLFVVNSLLASVCAALVSQGERARELSLVFSLTNRTQHVHPLRSSRPSADQKRWLRMIRDALEQVKLVEAVTGLGIRVESVTGNDGAQGDFFDRGFASAGVVEATLAQLADDHGELIVSPVVSRHPLADKRTLWETALDERPAASAGRASRGRRRGSRDGSREPSGGSGESIVERERAIEGAPVIDRRELEVEDATAADRREPEVEGRAALFSIVPGEEAALASIHGPPGGPLTLQLFDAPRTIAVATEARRDHEIPVRYRDETGWHALIDVAGPDRVSGGEWDSAYAREYFRCVRDDGALLWVYHGPRTNEWFLHGWWD